MFLSFCFVTYFITLTCAAGSSGGAEGERGLRIVKPQDGHEASRQAHCETKIWPKTAKNRPEWRLVDRFRLRMI